MNLVDLNVTSIIANTICELSIFVLFNCGQAKLTFFVGCTEVSLICIVVDSFDWELVACDG